MKERAPCQLRDGLTVVPFILNEAKCGKSGCGRFGFADPRRMPSTHPTSGRLLCTVTLKSRTLFAAHKDRSALFRVTAASVATPSREKPAFPIVTLPGSGYTCYPYYKLSRQSEADWNRCTADTLGLRMPEPRWV